VSRFQHTRWWPSACIGDSYGAAAGYATRWEKDTPLVLRETAFRDRDDRILTIKVQPYFDRIRFDPRYADLIHRIGLPQ
jgi:hypothetical protein